jgi:PST family polysaccharide transporter
MSFARILRSSAIMGGAQVVTLATAFIRTKVVAQLMGPAGVGLAGILTAFNGNVSTLAAWGLGTSGVRLIASAPPGQTASTQAAVRKFGTTLTWLGFWATVLLFLPVSYLTFGTGQYALELLIGGMAVPCIIANSIWGSILQAAGHVKSLAKGQILSAFIGLFLGLPSIYFFGSVGIAISLLLAAAAPMAFSWYVASKDCPSTGAEALSGDLRALFDMGGGLMIVGLAAQISAYFVRFVIIKNHGPDLAAGLADAGYYQASIAIAGSLPALVFSAMGTDFFPRVAAAKGEAEAKMLSEKQIEAGLLLALPIFTGLLTMNRLGIRILYADKFDAALPLLDWMIWGVFLRLLAWPLGYWMLARGAPRTVVIVELGSNLMMAILPLLLIPSYGLVGAAMAFFIGNLAYAAIMIAVARKRSGRWLSLRTFGFFIPAAIVLALSQYFSRLAPGMYWGAIPTALVAACCVLIYLKALDGQNDE